MRAKGDDGQLLAGGRLVATLRRWSLEHGPDGMRAEARLEAPNRWLLSFAPEFDATFVMGKSRLTWRGVTVEVLGGEVVIQGGKRDG